MNFVKMKSFKKLKKRIVYVGEIKEIQLIPIARESLSDKWLLERDFYFKKGNDSGQSFMVALTIFLCRENILM
jgi:hypothetical protein